MKMARMRTMLLGLLTSVCTVAMADDYAYLTIAQDGGESSFAVNEISKITFDATNMIVTLSNGTTQKFPLSGLNKMFFSENGLSAIAEARASQSHIRLEGVTLHVKASQGEAVTLYNMNGQSVMQEVAQGDDTQLNLSNLKRGVYIVKVGTVTKKVMSR